MVARMATLGLAVRTKWTNAQTFAKLEQTADLQHPENANAILQNDVSVRNKLKDPAF